MAVHFVIKCRASRQGIDRIKMFARTEYARISVLQTDLHMPTHNKHPLTMGTAVELAPKPNRAMAELIAAARHQCRQARLRCAFCQWHGLLFEARAPIGVCEENSKVTDKLSGYTVVKIMIDL